jgi:hypothetical protein
VSDQPPDGSTPAWGWLIIVLVLAMFAALLWKTLSTGS